MSRTVPVAENLIEELPEGPCLIGGRHKMSGKVVFPLPEGDSGAQYERIRLGSSGTLWSWTVQRFQPKPPYIPPEKEGGFVPYAVGYIEMPDVIVEARIEAEDFSKLRIGQEMTLVTLPLHRATKGDDVHTYAFRPHKPNGDRT